MSSYSYFKLLQLSEDVFTLLLFYQEVVLHVEQVHKSCCWTHIQYYSLHHAARLWIIVCVAGWRGCYRWSVISVLIVDMFTGWKETSCIHTCMYLYIHECIYICKLMFHCTYLCTYIYACNVHTKIFMHPTWETGHKFTKKIYIFPFHSSVIHISYCGTEGKETSFSYWLFCTNFTCLWNKCRIPLHIHKYSQA